MAASAQSLCHLPDCGSWRNLTSMLTAVMGGLLWLWSGRHKMLCEVVAAFSASANELIAVFRYHILMQS